MNIAIDCEFYQENKEVSLKQIGLIFFNNDITKIKTFEKTIINSKDKENIKKILNKLFEAGDKLFIWGGINDLKVLKELEVNLDTIKIIDVQFLFNLHKGNNNTLGKTYQKSFGIEPKGLHNALIDAYYLAKIVIEYKIYNDDVFQSLNMYYNMLYTKNLNNTLNKILDKTLVSRAENDLIEVLQKYEKDEKMLGFFKYKINKTDTQKVKKALIKGNLDNFYSSKIQKYEMSKAALRKNYDIIIENLQDFSLLYIKVEKYKEISDKAIKNGEIAKDDKDNKGECNC